MIQYKYIYNIIIKKKVILVDKNEIKINAQLLTGWVIITLILLVSYFVEVFKKTRDPGYMFVFTCVCGIPPIVCSVVYKTKKNVPNFRYWVLGGYFIMYAFALFTSKSIMVSTYILPMLSLIVLYHKPRLVLSMGGITLILNIIYDIREYKAGKITMENSATVEIQMALILLCFGFLYTASQMYKKISDDNDDYVKELDSKRKSVQNMTLQTVTTIANIIDAKDRYTKGHSQRVAEYSADLAREMGYSEEEAQNVKFIGLLHDIGKIGIPDSILNKPGRLSDEEFKVMKSHPAIGANVLKDNYIINGLEEGAKYHHERYDGRGYPDGISGDNIPEIARIIGIADAYDAMTSNRIYRKRLSDEQVIAEIRRCSGTQFHPDVAEVFIKMLESGRLKQRSPDQYQSDETVEEKSAELLRKIIQMQNRNDETVKQHDYLTEAYNRRFGETIIRDQLEVEDGALILLDIMNIRKVNSVFGLMSGDRLIKKVADVLLSYRIDMTVARHNGDVFVCFIPGIKDSVQIEDAMKEIIEYTESEIFSHKEYKNVKICIGGALSVISGNKYDTLLLEADKALFYVKQFKKSGYYLYREGMHGSDNVNLSKVDLNNLITNLKNGESPRDLYTDFPEFKKTYEFMESLTNRNNQNIQIIMLTLNPINDKKVTIDSKEEAMLYLERAIESELRRIDIMMRFSSTQCVVFFMNLTDENISNVVGRLIKTFYQIYDHKDMVLSYDAADITNGEKCGIE